MSRQPSYLRPGVLPLATASMGGVDEDGEPNSPPRSRWRALATGLALGTVLLITTSAVLVTTDATRQTGRHGQRLTATGAPRPSVVGGDQQTPTTQSTEAQMAAASRPGSTSGAHASAPQRSPSTSAPISPSATKTPSTTNLAVGKTLTASSSTSTQYLPANANDANTGTYWESTNNAFPQWLTIDLGSSVAISKVTIELPPLTIWTTRTQTFSISGSVNGSTFTAVTGSSAYTFNPATGNVASVSVSTTTRYLRLTFTGNTVQHAGQVSELQVYG